MKIVFMGTPEFAVPSLKMLIEKHDVIAVFTQPDKPKGRGKKLGISEVKEASLIHNIKIYQPIKLKNEPDVIEEIRNMEPDFIIVVAFGQILTKEVLDIPKYGCINLHASLLPKYRGAAPINWAIINGEKVSGNTTMLMDIGIDTGDMFLKDEVTIEKNMTSGELHDILMLRGAKLLEKTIEGIVDGTIEKVKQIDSESNYASMLNKDLAKIDWNKSESDINNLIRGLNPWPVAYTTYNDNVMKIYKALECSDKSNAEAGTILDVSKEGIKVATKGNNILLDIIQFPGGKPLKVSEYIKGHNIETGVKLY